MTDLRQEAVRLVDFARTHIFFEATNAIERALAERERVIARLREALLPFAEVWRNEISTCSCKGDGHAVRMDPEAWRNADAALSPTGESASQGTQDD